MKHIHKYLVHRTVYTCVLSLCITTLVMPSLATAQINTGSSIPLQGYAWSGYTDSLADECSEEDVARDVLLVMDRSGSMNGNDPNDTTAQAAVNVVQSLDTDEEIINNVVQTVFDEEDMQVGVITFSTNARLQQRLTNNVDDIINTLQNLVGFKGNTNLGTGLSLAIDDITSNANPETENVVVIFSDGYNQDTLNAAVRANLLRRDYDATVIAVLLNPNNSMSDYYKHSIVSSPAADHYYSINNVSQFEDILSDVVTECTEASPSSFGVGWIDMNEVVAEPVAAEVYADLTGYAWSSNIGWIKFHDLDPNDIKVFPDIAGTPDHSARLYPNGEVTGWARACAATVGGDCTSTDTAADSGGWDGWIALNGANHSVRFTNTGAVADSYAWGGTTNVGWIDMFSHVVLDLPAAAILNATACNVGAGASSCPGSVDWEFGNADNPAVQKTTPLTSTLMSSANPYERGEEDPHTMQLGVNAFEAIDNSGVLDTAVVDISCVANASDVAGVCQCDTGYISSGDTGTCIVDPDAPAGSLTVNPSLVRKNQDVTATWNTNADACTVTTSQGDTLTGSGSDSGIFTVTSTYQVLATLTCEGVIVDTAVVQVLPYIFES